MQVSLTLQHQSTWNFRTVFGHRKCVRRCSIVTSQQIQDGGRPPFWRSLNHHISLRNRPILIKFGTLQQQLNPMTVTWPKSEILKIQDGGGRHLENRFFGHNSSTDCPISAKFCTKKQNGMSTRTTWQKLLIFKYKMVRRRLCDLHCMVVGNCFCHFVVLTSSNRSIASGARLTVSYTQLRRR